MSQGSDVMDEEKLGGGEVLGFSVNKRVSTGYSDVGSLHIIGTAE